MIAGLFSTLLNCGAGRVVGICKLFRSFLFRGVQSDPQKILRYGVTGQGLPYTVKVA